MQLPRLFTSWVCTTFGLLEVQALIFDILRNPPALTSHDVCAILRCQARADDRDTFDIHHIISLAISEKGANQNSPKPLASLSVFEAGITTLGDDPERINATGYLSTNEGELSVQLKGPRSNCLSGIFVCKLGYMNSKMEGKVVTAEKQFYAAVKKSETSNQHQVSDTLKSLKTLIAEEVSKLSEQAENATTSVASIVTSMDERLLRIESIFEGDLKTRLDNLDFKLNNLEVLLREHVDVKLKSLTEVVANSTDDIKSSVISEVHKTQLHMNIIEASITDRIVSTESSMNNSFRDYLESREGCEILQANISSMFGQIQDNISTIKINITGRLSAVDNNMGNSNNLLSTRLIMESLVRIVHNISTFDNKLVKLKSDVDAEMKATKLSISTLNDNMVAGHLRLTREVKQNITSLESLLAVKFKELEKQKTSLASLDQEMKGKLLNVEINLKDVNVVVRSIKYIFGL
ncbi:hypothetical protein BsWGS_03664 [Bradybaena similaris]